MLDRPRQTFPIPLVPECDTMSYAPSRVPD